MKMVRALYPMQTKPCEVFLVENLEDFSAMVCYHGCVPEGGYLDEETEYNLLKKIGKLLGDEPSVFTSTPEEVASVLMTQGLSPQAARELSHRLLPTKG